MRSVVVFAVFLGVGVVEPAFAAEPVATVSPAAGQTVSAEVEGIR